MNLLYEAIPRNVPKPVGYGTYKEVPDTHFYACEYREMQKDDNGDNIPPRKSELAVVAANLHRKTVRRERKFGSEPGKKTLVGSRVQHFPQSSVWAECFAAGLRCIFKAESKAHMAEVQDGEFSRMQEVIMNEITPRLLRPLQEGGRQIHPCVVHGDLWTQNIGIDRGTSEPLIYDAGVLYAHNECKHSSAPKPYS